MTTKVYATVAIDPACCEGALKDKVESLLMDGLAKQGADLSTVTMEMYLCEDVCSATYRNEDHWHWTAIADLR